MLVAGADYGLFEGIPAIVHGVGYSIRFAVPLHLPFSTEGKRVYH
jgi:hypothetical protein